MSSLLWAKEGNNLALRRRPAAADRQDQCLKSAQRAAAEQMVTCSWMTAIHLPLFASHECYLLLSTAQDTISLCVFWLQWSLVGREGRRNRWSASLTRRSTGNRRGVGATWPDAPQCHCASKAAGFLLFPASAPTRNQIKVYLWSTLRRPEGDESAQHKTASDIKITSH